MAGHDRFIADLRPLFEKAIKMRGLQLGILAKSLIVTKQEPIDNGSVIALIGPGQPSMLMSSPPQGQWLIDCRPRSARTAYSR